MRTSRESQFRKITRKWLGRSRFVTVILDDGWFRLLLLLSLLAVGCVVVLTPNFWITTPKGVVPVKRVSFLDMIAARQLHARAQADAAAGDIHTAANTWQMARQRNPGNLELLRGSTRNLLTMQDSLFENRTEALGLAAWLVGASQTNHADVVLASQVFEAFKAPEQVVVVTDPKPLRESQDLVVARFGALLRLGLLGQVQRELKALPPSVRNHPDTQLFQSALSVLSAAPDAGIAREGLRAASEDPQKAALALRLLYQSSLHDEDIATAKDALRQLVGMKRNELQDHLILWKLLFKKGDTTEASKRANENVPNPLTGAEAFQLASTLAHVDRVDLATQVLRREIPRHTQSLDLCILQAEILATTKDWHALRASALQMRQSLAENQNATALSHLMEAEGFTGLKMLGDAKTSLDHLKETELTNPALALYAGRVLNKMGAHAMVENILLPFKVALGRDPSYWTLLFDAGFSAKSTDLILSSSKQALELEPDNPECINRRAAALIIVREASSEALQLTQRLKSLFPTVPGATINLAQAFLLNSRHEEAARLLNEIEPRKLTPLESNPFWLASAELALFQNDLLKSNQCLGQLRTNELFPSQTRWLEGARRSLEK